jgi:hypothetical protein
VAHLRVTNDKEADHDLREFVKAYLDDIFCFSDDFESHLYHLDRTLQRCADNHLYINMEKAAVGAAEAAVLGFEAGRGKKSITVDRLAAIAATPPPATREAMKRWLGVAGFLRDLRARLSGFDPAPAGSADQDARAL